MAAEAKEIKVTEVKEAPVEETKQENVTTEEQEQQVPAEQPKEGFLTKVKRVATEKVIPATKKAVSTGLKVGAGIAIGFGIAKVLGAKNAASSTSLDDVPDESAHKDEYDDVNYNEINNDQE